MRWIHRNDPDDLARAAGCLERALELDPESGAPYGQLAYVYLRQNRIEKSLESGAKAVRFNPDVSISHYYLALAAWTAGFEISDSYFQEAVEHLLNAIEVEPTFSASWLNLAAIAMQTGAYDRAESLVGEVLSLRASGRAIVELPFGEMIQAEICARRLDWNKAMEWHEHGLKYLSQIDSVYRETAIALHRCGKAEIQLRQNNPQDALAELHRAWRTAQEFPNMMTHNRVLIRTMAGMASAYSALGEQARAEQLLKDAVKYLEAALLNPGGLIHGVMPDDLCHPMAVAYVRLNNSDAAVGVLAKAVAKGCRDAAWMESDPELKELVESGRISSLIEKMRQFPALQFRSGEKLA
jgi:tetratricopeptide (TPR) repeat protein